MTWREIDSPSKYRWKNQPHNNRWYFFDRWFQNGCWVHRQWPNTSQRYPLCRRSSQRLRRSLRSRGPSSKRTAPATLSMKLLPRWCWPLASGPLNQLSRQPVSATFQALEHVLVMTRLSQQTNEMLLFAGKRLYLLSKLNSAQRNCTYSQWMWPEKFWIL